MVPEADRILVTIVASVLGTQSVNVSVPMRQGTPATATLSLMQRVLPLRRSDDGDLDFRLKRHAHAFSSLSSGFGK